MLWVRKSFFELNWIECKYVDKTLCIYRTKIEGNFVMVWYIRIFFPKTFPSLCAFYNDVNGISLANSHTYDHFSIRCHGITYVQQWISFLINFHRKMCIGNAFPRIWIALNESKRAFNVICNENKYFHFVVCESLQFCNGLTMLHDDVLKFIWSIMRQTDIGEQEYFEINQE